ARGPWSAHQRDVVIIVAEVPCFATTMKSMELASGNGGTFYIRAHVANAIVEAWSIAGGQLNAVGVDCDEELPSILLSVRDEVRAIDRVILPDVIRQKYLSYALARIAKDVVRIGNAPLRAQPVGGA